MIFDQPPAELPVATIRPRAPRARFLAELRNGLARKWRWCKPRSLPALAGVCGMLAVLGSAAYLRGLATQEPERVKAVTYIPIASRSCAVPVLAATPLATIPPLELPSPPAAELLLEIDARALLAPAPPAGPRAPR